MLFCVPGNFYVDHITRNYVISEFYKKLKIKFIINNCTYLTGLIMDYRRTKLNAGQYNKLMDDIFTSFDCMVLFIGFMFIFVYFGIMLINKN